ncbi:nucleotide sugar dehydrogenase [Jeotgalibacillus sp. S-D1]|uniref:nucleotide sugar dehydrogenase n=1 Tax=Jeotgalibacillus sp. S-D1 TaxID=2552189 RepID=UPI0010594B02|nr:nucleotide sugar dehydrogenase [Jeotgalibacillus sp. S-D1]TDL32840.1 nucleotide sugar dehydrogenase [Jeotgalibacillus sp. S-D1]
MNLYTALKDKSEKLSIIGLGYVGMPIAVAFAKKVNVIGFDVNEDKISMYKNGIDPTKEVGNEVISQSTVEFTANESRLKESKFHIVAVPTPVRDDRTPDLTPVKAASKTLGRNLTKGAIVVFESTVYPGVTEDVCLPILEQESGLKCGEDFFIGYSPERINPGDQEHRLETIVKVVAGMNEETLDTIAKVYELVVDAGVHRAESIKVAEAAKVIENAQRDINIAFMNELSIIFDKMNIDTNAVLRAAGTKWNFLKFSPGLVGGHCIGVDPYYLTYKAEQMGYYSQIILSGRKINDDMGKYVAESTIKKMIKANIPINGAKVAILGVTFKENCPDVRNTKVIDVINELKDYGIEVVVNDPSADKIDLYNEYGLKTVELNEINDVDAVIVAVPHKEFKNISVNQLADLYKVIDKPYTEVAASLETYNGSMYNSEYQRGKVLVDIKGLFNKVDLEQNGFIYWGL